MSRRRRIPLTFPPELASGPRIGGKFVGPYGGTMAIWKGRPPIMSDNQGGEHQPGTLQISAPFSGLVAATMGQAVTIEFEGGNAWGGLTSRTFQIGQGVSAELQAGQFAHISCRAVTPIIANQVIQFSWTWDPVNRSDLFSYLNYPLASVGVAQAFPEGTVAVRTDTAGTFTFINQLLGAPANFTVPVLAGDEIPVFWPAFSFNNASQFIFRLRGI